MVLSIHLIIYSFALAEEISLEAPLKMCAELRPAVLAYFFCNGTY